MAIIYGYPTGTPTTNDNVLGTQVDPVTEENKTVQFNIGQMNTLSANNFLETTTTLTKAQWQALQTTDVVLVPAPGASQYIKVLALSALFTPEAAGNQMSFVSLEIGTTASAATTKSQGVIPTSVSGVTTTTVYSIDILGTIIDAAQQLIIGTQTAVTGDGSLQIKVRYQILDTSAF
jgi:hypothetical protein